MICTEFRRAFVADGGGSNQQILPIIVDTSEDTDQFGKRFTSIHTCFSFGKVRTASKIIPENIIEIEITVSGLQAFPGGLLIVVTYHCLEVVITQIQRVVTQPLQAGRVPLLVSHFCTSVITVPVGFTGSGRGIIVLFQIVIVQRVAQ